MHRLRDHQRQFQLLDSRDPLAAVASLMSAAVVIVVFRTPGVGRATAPCLLVMPPESLIHPVHLFHLYEGFAPFVS